MPYSGLVAFDLALLMQLTFSNSREVLLGYEVYNLTLSLGFVLLL